MYNPIKASFQKITHEENAEYTATDRSFFGRGLSKNLSRMHDLK